jgi:hypothetical protein
MVRRFLPVCLLAAAGCLNEQSSTPLVPSNPFGAPVVQTPKHVAASPASEEAARRVGLVGQKVVAANPQLGARPLFRTIGAPHPEVFHVGTSQVCVTEGLVKQCATEGQLAAVLCVELGKMVAEREALAGPQARTPERPPPVELPVGNDSGGRHGAADLTHLAELGRYEKENRRGPAGPLPPPDPQAVARTCLLKAGYQAADLDAAAVLLKASAANSQLEKQLTQPPVPVRPWTTP